MNKRNNRMLLTALAVSLSLSMSVQTVMADQSVDDWNSIRKAIQNATGTATGTITLTADIAPGVFSDRDKIELGNNNVTINGAGYTFSGSRTPGGTHAGNIIVNSGYNLTITNLTQQYFTRFLQNNGGKITISNSSFNSNRLTGDNGNGAVINNVSDGILNIQDSDFKNNSLTGANANGGAIYNAGTSNVSGSTFSNNSLTNAGTNGGAIYNDGTLNVSAGSTFSANSVDAGGGAIYNNRKTVSITDSTFTGNSAYNGGAVTNNSGTVYIEGSTFENNEATEGNGGAIDTWGGVATIVDSSFKNNHANSEFDSDIFWNGDSSISGEQQNLAQAGGAISNNNGNTLNIVALNDNVEFTGNYVGELNSSIFGSSDSRFSNAIINRGTVNLNAAEGQSIIFNDTITYSKWIDGTININKPDVQLSDASVNLITTPSTGTIEINNAVYDQIVNMYGGTLKFGSYTDGESWQNGTGGFDATADHYVTFNYWGGLIDTINDAAGSTSIGYFNQHGDMYLAIDALGGEDGTGDVLTYGSYSNPDGASIYFSKVNLGENDKFYGIAGSENSSDWALFKIKEDMELVGANNRFDGKNTLVNYNTENGHLKVGLYTLQEAVSETTGERYYRLLETENVAVNLGEMLDAGTLTIAGNNQAIAGNGNSGIGVGAGDTLIIKEVSSFGGFSGDNGAALNISGGSVSAQNTVFENNTASSSGGAVNVSGGTFAASDSGFSGNSAKFGGGIYTSGGKVKLNNSTITNNNATALGGGIYAGESANVILTGGSITENTAGEGAAIYNESLNMLISDTNITGNRGSSSIYNKGAITIATTEAGKTISIDNLTSDGAQGVIKNGGTIDLNALTDSSISIKDSILGQDSDIAYNIININSADGASGSVSTGNVTNSTVNVKNGSATIAGAVNSAVTSSAASLNILGEVSNSSKITTTAGVTTLDGAVSGSTVSTSGGTTILNGTVSDKSLISTTNGSVTLNGAVAGSTLEISGGSTIANDKISTSTVTQTGGELTISSMTESKAEHSDGTLKLGDTLTKSEINSAGGTVELGTAGGNTDFSGSTLTLGNSQGGVGSAALNASKISGGLVTINSGSSLSTAGESTIASSISGAGEIKKTGAAELTFSAENGANGADFTGTISAEEGTVNLVSDYLLNGNANIDLSSAILNYTVSNTKAEISNSNTANINLNGNASANIKGNGAEASFITVADKFWTMTGSNNTLTLSDAEYTLAREFTTGDDVVNFSDSNVLLAQSGQNYGQIAMTGSHLDLTNQNAGDEYSFNNLTSNGTNTFGVDVNLYLNDTAETPSADKIVVNNGGGTLQLTELFITNDNGMIGQAGEAGKNIQLIQNNGQNVLRLEVQEGIDILSWATNVYEYGVKSASSDGQIIDSINIAEDGPSSTDTLRDLNMYVGAEGYQNRGFSFVIDSEGKNEYNIYRDLDTTTGGNFTIIGRYGTDNSKSILSGELKDLRVAQNSNRITYNADAGTYTYVNPDGQTDTFSEDLVTVENGYYVIPVGVMGNAGDKYGSMFELVNETNLKISAVSIEKAKRYNSETETIKDGAVIYANNLAATVTLDGVDFKNNSVAGGNGGAIANILSKEFSINNAVFANNSASGNGGAIYNAADQTINISANTTDSTGVETAGLTQFSSNSAALGGAIYNAGTINMSTSGEGSKIIVDEGTDTARNDIYNTGTLNLDGDITINSAITNAEASSGTTNINGGSLILGENASIEQNILTIADGVDFKVNANQLTIADAISNAGTLTFTGGANANAVANSGSLVFDGATSNSGAITGGGTTTIASGSVTNTGTITQQGLEILNGAGLSTSANDLKITDAITNAGTLTFTGGTNANDITGGGETTIASGSVNNSALIEQAVSITGGTLTSAAENLGGTITNNSALVLSGTLDKNISGDGITSINSELAFNDGAGITGTLNMNGGLLNLNDGVGSAASITSHEIGKLTGNGAIKIDTDMNLAQSDRLIVGAAEDASVNISSVNITADHVSVDPDTAEFKTVQVVDGNAAGDVNLTLGTTGEKLATLTSDYMYEFVKSDTDGAVQVYINKTTAGLKEFIEGSEATETVDTYSMTRDESAPPVIGTTNRDSGSAELNLNINGHTLSGSESDSGITIADGYTLNVAGGNGTVSDFVTAFKNEAGGKLSLSDVIFSGNDTDVNNDGTLTLAGNNTISGGISGSGTTDITGGTTIMDSEISQTQLNIAQGAVIKGSASNLKSTVDSDGVINFTGGENTSTITGDGTLNITANTANSGDVTQNKLEISSGKTLTNAGSVEVTGTLSNTGAVIANNGALTLSGENMTNSGTISGSGTTTVSGKVQNSGTISQNVLSNTGTFITDASSVKTSQEISNTGILEFTGGENSNKISGEGTLNITGTVNNTGTIAQEILNNTGTLTSNASNITVSDHIQNTGTLVFNGGTNANDITGSGSLNIHSDTANSGNVTQNKLEISSGKTLTNTGSVEVTETLTNTGAVIANNGTLTLSGENMTNSGTISGSGTTTVAGKVTNNGTIEQAVEINKSAELTSNADDIKDTVLNNGAYNVTGGTIANAISGTGDLNITNSVILSNTISGNNINLANGMLSFEQSADISGSTLIANGGSINLQNEAVQNTNLGNLILNSDLNLMLDGSFAEKQLDTISANAFTNNGDYNINISNIVLSSPTKDVAFSISPLGTGMSDQVSAALAGAIQYTGSEIVYSPLYRYTAAYDPETALMNFNRVSGGGYSSYNPGVFAGAVAAQLGGYLTQLNSYDEAFRNMDMYMLMTQKQRQAMKLRNKYAASDSDLVFDPTISQYENTAGWFRPYATFEKVDLKGGPTVSNVAYGSFFGAESEMYDLGHGWDGIWGVYGGYNGSHQSYDGVGIYQNGGTLGVIGMAYKGNFFTGLTANVGANAGEASTMYGQDNFNLLMSGVASKSGYNWELAEGKFIVQPHFLMSYSYVNTFNYKDASGVSITSDPLHAIQLEPGIKFIGNLKNGWQPYASVSMVWNIMDKTEFQANYVPLPQLSVKPFVKYGVGVRKAWGERFTGYFQTYLTNGGRNGVGLQLGLRWMLGKKQPAKQTNGAVPELKKTEIKVGRK